MADAHVESPKRARASPPLIPKTTRLDSPARGRLHGYDCNNPTKVEAFIRAGGKVNAGIDGFLGQKMTPLAWACFYQSVACVQLLLDAGADANIQSGPKHKTALEIAHERACPQTILDMLSKPQQQ